MSSEQSSSDTGSIRETRERHMGRLFLNASRSFAARATEKLRERGHAGLGASHTAVLPHVELEGSRATVIAERAGMTKQAVGQVLRDLESQGYVERVPDPLDGRATLVRFTESGWSFLEDARRIKTEIEAEYTAVLGEERMSALRESLEELLRGA